MISSLRRSDQTPLRRSAAIERLKVRRNAMILCRFQGFVRETLVVEGKLMGICLPIDPPRAK